jgi:hypothetical protein
MVTEQDRCGTVPVDDSFEFGVIVVGLALFCDGYFGVGFLLYLSFSGLALCR